MQLRYRHQVAAAGVSVAALALVLGACSSSSSSSPASGGSGSAAGGGSSSSSSSNLSGTLNASGSSFQLSFQQQAISSFKSVQSGMTVNYGGGGSGKGRTDLAAGTVNFAGSDTPIPSKDAASFQGRRCCTSPSCRPDHGVVQPAAASSSLQLSPDDDRQDLPGQIKTWNDPAIAAD